MPGSNLSVALVTEAWEAVSADALTSPFIFPPCFGPYALNPEGLGAGPQANKTEFLLIFSGFPPIDKLRGLVLQCLMKPLLIIKFKILL